MNDELDRPSGTAAAQSAREADPLQASGATPADTPAETPHADLYDVPPTPQRAAPVAGDAGTTGTERAVLHSAGEPERDASTRPGHPDGFPGLDRHRQGAGDIAKRWLGILAFVAITLAGAIWAVHRVVTLHQADAKHARDVASDRPAGGRSFDSAAPAGPVAHAASGASGTAPLSVVAQSASRSASTAPPDHRPGTSPSAPAHPAVSWYDADLIVGSGDAPAGESAAGAAGSTSGSVSGSLATSDHGSALAAPAADGGSSVLTAALSPTQIHAVQAGLTGNRDLRLSAGAKIPCAGDTAFDSTLAGISTCTVTSDVYSDNGHVLLIGRGSTVNTEFRSAPAQGQRRVFILSARIQTPDGVTVQIDSPAADALGRMGIDGEVNNHWGERLGAAFLLSLVQDSIGYLASRSNSSNGTVVFENTQQTGNDMADRVLNSTINIPPTITKNQGADFLIVLARDIDFSNVYQLEAK
ncbi:type IV secretion system protein VirB10 [Burkholderia multivorans]|nr:type IV secretion system protein VirB10 [Burkholderia multivorans]